jgi:hypothetical protein
MTTAQSGRLIPKNINGQQVFTTTEGTSRRGLAYQRLNENVPNGKKRVPVRLMPESILALAKDRDDAIRLLRLHAFIL